MIYLALHAVVGVVDMLFDLQRGRRARGHGGLADPIRTIAFASIGACIPLFAWGAPLLAGSLCQRADDFFKGARLAIRFRRVRPE